MQPSSPSRCLLTSLSWRDHRPIQRVVTSPQKGFCVAPARLQPGSSRRGFRPTALLFLGLLAHRVTEQRLPSGLGHSARRLRRCRSHRGSVDGYTPGTPFLYQAKSEPSPRPPRPPDVRVLAPAGPGVTDLDDLLQLPVVIHHKDVHL